MTRMALEKLNFRSDQLKARLKHGSSMEIKAARELMRHAMVELYDLGYWRNHPDQLNDYMNIYRSCERGIDFTVTVSMSGPDKMVQCSP